MKVAVLGSTVPNIVIFLIVSVDVKQHLKKKKKKKQSCVTRSRRAQELCESRGKVSTMLNVHRNHKSY